MGTEIGVQGARYGNSKMAPGQWQEDIGNVRRDRLCEVCIGSEAWRVSYVTLERLPSCSFDDATYYFPNRHISVDRGND